jgi:hypothetical protein
MAAESEPAFGSVMAIEIQRLPNLAFCSGVPTAARAALPRPWRGIVRARPTSPQQSSIIDRTVAMLPPFLVEPAEASSAAFFSLSSFESCAAEAAPPPSFTPSMMAASRSSSFGYSCSARSYLREIGRNTFTAMPCACSMRARNRFGVSR